MTTTNSSLLPLTVIIITNRSDQRFKQALASCQLAQQIIIVDHQSEAEWSELATQFSFQVQPLPAKFFSHQQLTDFSAVRNYGLSLAKFDWVLFIDSDEELIIDDQARDKLSEAISQDKIGLFYLTRSDVFHQQRLDDTEAGRQSLARLINKKNSHFAGSVHERAVSQQPAGKLPILINHHSHPNLDQFLTQIGYYAQLVAQERYHQHYSLSVAQQNLKCLSQLFIFPPLKFLSNLLIKKGILAGWRGLIYSSVMSLHSLLVRIYWWELINAPQKK